MGEHVTTKSTFTGATLIAAMAAGVLAAGGLGSAPAANATCASFFGIGNSANCTSSPTSIAIAIGADAKAEAKGLFGTAIAIGQGVKADTASFPQVFSLFDAAIAVGFPGEDPKFASTASAGGVLSLAVSAGQFAHTLAGGDKPGLGNVALNLFGKYATQASTSANGFGTVAIDAFGRSEGQDAHTHDVGVYGVLSGAINLFGTNNKVFAEGATTEVETEPVRHLTFGSLAFNVLGDNNNVNAGESGPLAIAGAIGQKGVTVEQKSIGVNIYARVGSASKKASAAKATHRLSPGATATHSSARASAAGSGRR